MELNDQRKIKWADVQFLCSQQQLITSSSYCFNFKLFCLLFLNNEILQTMLGLCIGETISTTVILSVLSVLNERNWVLISHSYRLFLWRVNRAHLFRLHRSFQRNNL